MKQLSLLLLCFTLSFSTIAQETWMVDNAHSNVRFEVGWQDFSMRTGEFKTFDGSITTDSKEDLSNAAIEFIVDATSLDVISEKLANHLKSDDFLDVENFPEITFVSNEATKNSDNTYISHGILTAHGVEKETDVMIKVKGSKETRRGYILGLEVNLEVNRLDFGLDWGSPRLGETITIVGHLLFKLKMEEEND